MKGWLGMLDPLSQHGGCDVIEGTKWVANLWLTLVGEPDTGDAFKGWIDHGKDENMFQPGTNWRGETIKTDDEKEKDKEIKEVKKEEESENRFKKENMEDKEKKIEDAKTESSDGSYDVKLEL